MLILKSKHQKEVDELNLQNTRLVDEIWRRAYVANFVSTLERIVTGEDIKVIEKRRLDEKVFFLCYSKYNCQEMYSYCEYVKMKSKKEAEKWRSKIWENEDVISFVLEVNKNRISLLHKLGKSKSDWSHNEKEDYVILFREYNRLIENVIGHS